MAHKFIEIFVYSHCEHRFVKQIICFYSNTWNLSWNVSANDILQMDDVQKKTLVLIYCLLIHFYLLSVLMGAEVLNQSHCVVIHLGLVFVHNAWLNIFIQYSLINSILYWDQSCRCKFSSFSWGGNIIYSWSITF